MEKLGIDKAKAAKEEAQGRALMMGVRNDALLKTDDFRSFLKAVADRAGYFDASSDTGEWFRGYRDALNDLVNGVVRNSTLGGAFLSEYLAEKQNRKGRTEDENME